MPTRGHRAAPQATRRALTSASRLHDLFTPAHLLVVRRCCSGPELSLSPFATQPRAHCSALAHKHTEMVGGTWTLEHTRKASSPCSGSSQARRLSRHQKHSTNAERRPSNAKKSSRNQSMSMTTGAGEAVQRLDHSGPASAWYGSFVVQHDATAMTTLFQALPFAEPPVKGLCHLNCAWLFFGQNRDKAGELPGRDEHTDKVSHDGTWHLQLAGRKRWRVRPTLELLDTCGDLPVEGYDVVCGPGDLLIINTRLWWHQTSIPDTTHAADGLSVSVARDFRFDHAMGGMEEGDNAGDCDMTNVDGLFATNDVLCGTVIVSEEDALAAGLEIEVSDDPNCEVVELDDGSTVLVSVRDIAAGEWFTVAKGDDDDA
eukprot:m.8459 g.8459  ORF g.8459 m.8459 type:complete len:372 (-) comp2540_c0_seq1:233-1348(-)